MLLNKCTKFIAHKWDVIGKKDGTKAPSIILLFNEYQR